MKDGTLRESTPGQALLPPCQPWDREGALGLDGPRHPLLPHPEGLGKLRGRQLSLLSEKKLKEAPGPQPGAPLLEVNFCGFSLPFSYLTWIVTCSW